MFRLGAKSPRAQSRKRLGELLLDEGIITKEQLQQALDQQRTDKGFIGQILVEQKTLSQDTLTNYLVKQCKIPHLNLLDYEIDDQALAQIPEEVCLEYHVLPIDKLGRILTLAMVDPLDTEALEKIKEQTPDLRIKPMLCNWDHFQAAIKRVFNKETQKPKGLDAKYARFSIASTDKTAESDQEEPPEEIELEETPEPDTAEPDTAEPDTAEPDAAEDAFDAELDEAVEMTAREEELSRPAVSPAPTPSVRAPDDYRELVAALRASLQDALGDIVQAVAQHAEAKQTGPDATQLAEAVQHSLESTLGALADELRQEREALREELRELAASKPKEQAAAPPATEASQENINAAMQEVLGAVAKRLDEVGEALKRTEKSASEMSPDLAKSLQETVVESARQSAEAMGAQLRSMLAPEAKQKASEQATPQALVETLKESVGAALENTLQALSEKIQALTDIQQRQIEATPHPPDFNEVAGLLRDQLGAILDKAIKGMGEQVRALVERGDEEKRRDVETLAEAVRDSIRIAVETMGNAQKTQQAELAALAKTTLEYIAQSTEAQSSQQQGLAGIIQETLHAAADRNNTQQNDLAHIAEAILHSIEHDKATQNEKQEQLAQIAQAALESVRQTTQLIEAHTVAENNRSDLTRRRQAQHASVASFPNSAPVASEQCAEEDNRVRDALDSERPLETLTFDNFFPGDANAFTFKLSKAVAEAPGDEYNPLFLYGKVGTGKTHLISAVGNTAIANKAKGKNTATLRVGYISASHFARRLAAAVEDNALELFRDNYCHWDMLILDDIQFLGGRVEAQEEFFHIFNVLLQEHRQIIIAADKAPDRLGLLEQRLVSRFASGIVAELKAPEWDTRMQILHHLAEGSKAKVPEEILSMIAMQVADDVRKMTGALRKIIAFSRLEGGKISMEEAQRILSHLGVNEAA